METRLVIDLLANHEQIDWFIQNEKGEVSEGPHRSSLSDLANISFNFPIYVLVPGEEVLLIAAKLPPTSKRRLLQVLPYALEDQLVDDISSLHFAVGEVKEGNPVPTAVVSHEQMRYWLEVLSTALGTNKTYLKALVPKTITVPWEKDTWSILIEQKVISVKSGPQTGFTFDRDNLATFLNLALKENAQTKPSLLNLYSIKGDFTPTEQAIIQNLGIRYHLNEINGISFLPLLSIGLTSSVILNLLQNEYQPKQKNNLQLQKSVRTILFMAVIGIAIHVFGTLVQYIHFSWEKNRLNSQIAAAYKEIFPKSNTVVAPETRITQELQNLYGNSSGNTFLKLLKILAPVAKQVPGITIKKLDFHGEELILDLQIIDLTSLDKLTTDLTKQGVQIKKDSVARENGFFKTKYIIKEAN